jgi:CDP-paratose 2-epimerase
VYSAVSGTAGVFHLAAQVAVTTSLQDPFTDFDVNVRGTLNVLEALRAQPTPAPLLFTSTNKVYGSMPDLLLSSELTRYSAVDPEVERFGIDERRGLDFHTPYGCSKGAADQYVLDYARNAGLPTVVFRMSCVYGPHQCGNEDQGWVAHLAAQALRGEPITIYGDGKQLRDILYVDDLVHAMELALARAPENPGRVFNIGGGPANTCSLLELLAVLHELSGRRPEVRSSVRRNGDQPLYVSDTRRFAAATGWSARIGVREGVARLHGWLREQLASGRWNGDANRARRAPLSRSGEAPASAARRNGRG